MMIETDTHLFQMLVAHFPPKVVSQLLATVAVDPILLGERGGTCSRAAIAQALNLGLLARLLERSPSARAYFDDLVSASRQLTFDHGALRTVDLPGMGSLPAGKEAIARVLLPLGYRESEVYPLGRLNMTGYAFRHVDFAESLPQFFVSELHVDRFSSAFRDAVINVTRSSADPLSAADLLKLETLAVSKSLSLRDAIALLEGMLGCFERLHDVPALSDYETLLAESAEMAWIATEGNAFNHATDRVADLEEVVRAQRSLGRAMKERIEVSRSGRVRQTAYRADPVRRPFLDAEGATVFREVPGSFFEFIARDPLPEESRLDLTFDSSNAQGIFKMTAAQAA